jgi:alcohol dehydrogenase (cytochrome c)
LYLSIRERWYFPVLNQSAFLAQVGRCETVTKHFATSLEDGLYASSAPLALKNQVLAGVAGGDTGMRGYIASFSPSTGEELWRTYTIPAKGEPGSETSGKLIDYGGGGTWLSGTYDPDLNTIYWTTGNPWPDFYGVDRGGDNLYSSSLLALAANSGKMKWYFQFTPHDTHDWDAQSWPALVDLPYGGQMRKLVLHANRNGFLYVLDRVTGQYLNATRLVDKLDWADGIDAKGRPILVPGKDPTPTGNASVRASGAPRIGCRPRLILPPDSFM